MELPLQRFGAFRVVSLLGRGGMGEVYLAWDERLRRHVALKRLHPGEDPSEAARERLRREARAVAALVHPAIVQVHDIVEIEGSDAAPADFIVMEFVDGEPVTTFLRRGILDLSLALRLAREIAEGLAAAHGRGLVHRDLKGDNVMVTAAGHAKILDFGLARPTDGKHVARAGTAYAMAPEQIRGEPLDGRTDLFALGVLLYEMTTGVRPFSGGNREAVFRAILHQEPRAPAEIHREIPQEVASLTLRLLAKDPRQRPAGAARVAEEIAAIERTLGLADRPWAAEPASSRISGSSGLEVSDWATVSRRADPQRRWIHARRGLFLIALLSAVSLLVTAHGPVDLLRPGVEVDAGQVLRVVVLEPELALAEGPENQAGDLRLAASAVTTALLGNLVAARGLQPLDPSQIPSNLGSLTALARSVGADELLWSRLEPWPGIGCRVSLRRVEGATGAVLWTSSFEAPLGVREFRLLADTIGSYLSKAYPRNLSAGSLTSVVARDEDYARFLAIWRAFKESGLVTEDQFAQIEQVVEGSPRFLPANLLAIDLVLSLFSSNRDPSLLEKARKWIDGAEAMAPEDPRPLYRRMRFSALAGDLDAADVVIDRLSSLSPGDPEILLGRAMLAERRGDLAQARTFLLDATRRSPAWSTFWRLARLELRAGQVDAARDHLTQVLDLAPDQPMGLAKLAELELLYGSISRARELYERQIELQPRRSLYTNLGLIHYLNRRFAEAKQSYQKALELAPDHPAVHLNLADTEMALGQVDEATRRYRHVLSMLRDLERTAALGANDRMIIAQCLAHLGQASQANEQARSMLAANPGDGEVAYQASVVFAILEDWPAALQTIREALELGVQARWFALPEFDGRREDVDTLLRTAGDRDGKPGG